MVYIIILNWNGATDTINCLKSLFETEQVNHKIVICDNYSSDSSYNEIKEFLILSLPSKYRSFVEMSREDAAVLRSDNDTGVYLIKNNANLGFAGGNNVGVKFAFNQKDMDFVWLLNNDTEVLPSTLFELLKKFGDNKRFGICGSRLVYFYERDKIQGLGGTLNPWLCTSKHYAWLEPSNTIYNELNVESEIDYVLGASMMLSRDLIEKVGYLCEDYFLYFEEFDLCKRARSEGFDIGVASKSIVYHKEGASTKSGKSDVADYFSVRNRILITKKFFPRYIITVKISILGVIINRLIRKEFKRAFRYMKFIFM